MLNRVIKRNLFFSKFQGFQKFSNYKLTQFRCVDTRFFEEENRTGVILTIDDKPGILAEILNVFSKNNVNLTYINSKPSKYATLTQKKVEFYIDIEGQIQEEKVNNSLAELKKYTPNVNIFKTEEVPWFPKKLVDLNQMGRYLLSANETLAADHPGFNDAEYRKRREQIVKISNSYYMEDGFNIPEVKYNEEETNLWSFMWGKLIPLHQKYACNEFNESFNNFIKECGFTRERIPQLKYITKYLKEKTNTIFRPVGGLLTQREFLNGLAFRVFHSTQYIRHKSKPLYTPEPDIIHELIGHAPLFANKDFADFSQEIGLASLSATDEDIAKLGTLYWFTVEFGVCLQNNERKVYGAGILSSPAELEYAVSDKPKMLPFDIFKIANTPFNITEIQPNYFLAPSFIEMKKEVIRFSETIKRPFNVTYNISTGEIEIDRHIVTRVESSIPVGDKLF
jgi:phenylalanine-4-hydroxylase